LRASYSVSPASWESSKKRQQRSTGEEAVQTAVQASMHQIYDCAAVEVTSALGTGQALCRVHRM
jgi:hypothetical protein